MSCTVEEAAFDRRYRNPRGTGLRCPACLQTWFHRNGLIRHMGKLHHACRFCPKAYIYVEHHEKRTHTVEWALAAGACKP